MSACRSYPSLRSAQLPFQMERPNGALRAAPGRRHAAQESVSLASEALRLARISSVRRDACRRRALPKSRLLFVCALPSQPSHPHSTRTAPRNFHHLAFSLKRFAILWLRSAVPVQPFGHWRLSRSQVRPLLRISVTARLAEPEALPRLGASPSANAAKPAKNLIVAFASTFKRVIGHSAVF